MKAKVVSLRFTALIFVSLFLLHSLRKSLAHAQHQAKVEDHIEAAIMKQNHGFAHNKVLNDANNNDVAKRKEVAIGGRKMIKGHHMYEGEEEEDDEKVMKNRRIPVVSGATKVKGVHYKVNDDDNQHHSASDHKLNEAFSTTDYHGDEGRNALKNSPKRSFHDSYNKQKAFHDPGSSSPASSAAKSKKLRNQDNESEARKDETKRLFEATKEIMKLMHKDYGGRWRPRRKPPIHNRIPQN